MALINKTGITNGGTIQAEHITRAIDALSGGTTDSVSITGSLMGSSSYALTASYALNGGGGSSFPFTGSAVITGSLIITGSLRVSGTNVTSSFLGGLCNIDATTINLAAVNLIIDTSAGSLGGEIHARKDLILDLSNISQNTSSGYFAIPRFQPPAPTIGAIYIDTNEPATLYVYNGADWYSFEGTLVP